MDATKMTMGPAQRVRIQAVVVAAAWLGLALIPVGCVTITKVRPQELVRLDGYQAATAPEAGRELETLDGETVKVRPKTALYVSLGQGELYGGRFESIQVRDGVFDGLTTERHQIRVPMDAIKGARVQETNVAATSVAVVGVVAGVLFGILFLAKTSEGQSSEGRALRVGGRVITARLAPDPAAAAAGWGRSASAPMAVDVASLSLAARAALATAWTERARSEHASVPAFSRLSLTLMAMGAPADLVEATHRAAVEEIGHARLAFGVAEAYAGAPVAPAPLAELLGGAPAVTALSLAELAAESLIDGCLMEGVAAAAAGAASACAADPAVRDALATIAREERSHAELGWAIVSWSCQQGGAEVARRLRNAIRHALPMRPPLEVPPDLEPEVTAHGFLAASAWRDLFQRERAGVASRLAVVAKLGVTAAS
jgi:hypothetical protein